MDARQAKVAKRMISSAATTRENLLAEKAVLQSRLASVDEKLADVEAEMDILDEGFGKQLAEADAVKRL